MDIDIKTISVVLGIASSIVALAFKLKPNPAARLKRDLELLKIARETQANYFALQRQVDSQIRGQYIARSLDRRARFELYFGNVLFYGLFGAIVFGFFGSLLALGAKAVFSVEDTTTAIIIFACAGLGLMGGMSGGKQEAGKEVRAAELEVESKADELIRSDEAAIRKIRGET